MRRGEKASVKKNILQSGEDIRIENNALYGKNPESGKA